MDFNFLLENCTDTSGIASPYSVNPPDDVQSKFTVENKILCDLEYMNADFDDVTYLADNQIISDYTSVNTGTCTLTIPSKEEMTAISNDKYSPDTLLDLYFGYKLQIIDSSGNKFSYYDSMTITISVDIEEEPEDGFNMTLMTDEDHNGASHYFLGNEISFQLYHYFDNAGKINVAVDEKNDTIHFSIPAISTTVEDKDGDRSTINGSAISFTGKGFGDKKTRSGDEWYETVVTLDSPFTMTVDDAWKGYDTVAHYDHTIDSIEMGLCIVQNDKGEVFLYTGGINMPAPGAMHGVLESSWNGNIDSVRPSEKKSVKNQSTVVK